jgi:hypothetical protein
MSFKINLFSDVYYVHINTWCSNICNKFTNMHKTPSLLYNVAFGETLFDYLHSQWWYTQHSAFCRVLTWWSMLLGAIRRHSTWFLNVSSSLLKYTKVFSLLKLFKEKVIMMMMIMITDRKSQEYGSSQEENLLT